ncbi:restriction endonuclease [Tetragenococcus halophilus]|uniref:Restriction endonuclease n=1 Tax=Tetragenococcus halophilus TaxID=51669 RepID=A0AB35HMM7_TETHA|nr:restriction endonuclease [Tetragenococcus halophilus]MCO8297451.1 restriction endonuclease [Tetragenococcus halophilus]
MSYKLCNKVKKQDNFENIIREEMPEILNILLLDRTTSTVKKKKNIIWANDNYIHYGTKAYAMRAQVKPELVKGTMEHVLVPRALKTRELQKSRTRARAEVFTPTWIVRKQNDEIEKDYRNDNLETYLERTWLEIACGEAPYMASRYDMNTGEHLPLHERVGFLDRKLARINLEINDKAEWQRLVELAYKSSYGFEWNGDSLLLARENLINTYLDYYFEKWKDVPSYGLLEEIAIIISYNVFQMDGLNCTIPLSEKKEKIKEKQLTLNLFSDDENEEKEESWIIKPGKRVKIMNWKLNKMEFFDKEVKGK